MTSLRAFWSFLRDLLLDQQEPRGRLAFFTRLTKGLIVIAILSLINIAIVKLGFYNRYDRSDLDKLTLYDQDAPLPVGGDAPAAVVLIDDDDYATYFASKSPLPSAPLLNIVQSLCQLHVAQIGVDLFTADWPATSPRPPTQRSTTHLDQTPQERDAILHAIGNCPVVWIRDAEPMQDQEDSFQLGGVLGHNALPANGACTAVPVFNPDPDGVIRSFSASVLAGSSPADLRPYATMANALHPPHDPLRCGYLPPASSAVPQPKPIGYNANANIIRLPASRFFFQGPEAGRKQFYEQLSQTAKQLGITGNTVVILGGSYRSARDKYNTPLGPMFGVEILANAAVGRPIREFPFVWGILLDLALSIAIFVLVNIRPFRFIWQASASLVVGLIMAFGFAWRLFKVEGTFYGVFAALAGAFIAVVGELIIDKLLEDFRSWQEARHPHPVPPVSEN